MKRISKRIKIRKMNIFFGQIPKDMCQGLNEDEKELLY